MNRVSRKFRHEVATSLVLALLSLAFVMPLCAQDSAPETTPDNNDDDSSRVVLVSLVDRKLAVVEDGVVIATFQVAVGTDVTPSPTGEFKVVSRVQNPTYYHPGNVIPAGKNNPLGTRCGAHRKKLQDTHHKRAEGYRKSAATRVHPAAKSRYREAVQAGKGWG